MLGCVCVVGSDAELDAAFGGEFDGVSEEIHEDLADAAGVCDEAGRERWRVMNAEVEFFVTRFGLEKFGNFEDDGVERARNRIDGHLAGFDFREVENVVDDGEQSVGGVTEGKREFVLLGIERGVEQKIGHADDAIHRGANFVAHGCEEFALGGAGAFGELLGALEFALDFLAAGDVDEAAFDDAGMGAGFIDEVGVFEHPDGAAVAAAEARLEIGKLAIIGKGFDAVFFVGGFNEFDVRARGEKVGARIVAEGAGAGVVAVENEAVERGAVERRHGAFEDEAIAFVAKSQLGGVRGEFTVEDGGERDHREH